ncbi:MAG: hypothetical protein JW757_06875 [Anaerolineales bacterium]|nr:hypothetical protein [Anaerolineales bacterium]
MISGMLWFDNDKKTSFASKVDRAVLYYKKKYGQMPDVCFVHPQMVPEDKDTPAANLEVKASPGILLHHFWIGTKHSVDKEGS